MRVDSYIFFKFTQQLVASDIPITETQSDTEKTDMCKMHTERLFNTDTG